MKKSFLLSTFSLACLISFCQSNYQPATVELKNGYSQTGEIDYRNWKLNPSTISFRKDKLSAPATYSVNELESFSVANDVYKSAVVEIFERTNKLEQLTSSDLKPSRNDTVFLLTVVNGPKSLYRYTDNVDHFYIADNNQYQLLKFGKYKVEEEVLVATNYYSSGTKGYVATNISYIGQLRQYLGTCAKVADKLRYDVNSLRKAFVSYYSCAGKDPEYLQEQENERIEISAIVGASNTTFKVNTERNDLLERVGFSSSVDFAAGAGFDLVFPRGRGKTSLNNELLYTSYKAKGEYHNATTPVLYDHYTYQFEYSYLKLNTMLRHKFFAGNMIIFINGGISNGIVLSEVNKLVQVHSFNDDITTTEKKGFNETRKHELGFLAGGGVRKNRISLELRAEKGNGPLLSSGYKAAVVRYFALVSYRIK